MCPFPLLTALPRGEDLGAEVTEDRSRNPLQSVLGRGLQWGWLCFQIKAASSSLALLSNKSDG